ncbi:MAG TPA: YfhO family protein [Thermoanaerobaculia bacterium]|nr:YfhO family protein [Thermoanaerobaculia bacterium]
MFNGSWLLVGIVYAAAVWLARRAGADLPRRVATFFYLLVFIFLHQSLTRDFVNLPVDFLRTLPPWSFLTRDHVTLNPDMNDLVLQIVPWAHQVRESWLSFDVPLWNERSGAGYPLLANAQSSALSLIRLLSLPLPLGQSFAAEAAMKILIALTFTYLFCRRRGYSELASAIGAVCFGFCSFLIVWLHFPLVTVACFVPAALYAIDLIAERRSPGRVVFAAVLSAVMIFGGHPETVAHIFFISLLYTIWIVAVERPFSLRDSFRFLLTLGMALTAGALLAAPFLAPFAEAMTKSKRYHELQLVPNVIGYYSDWPSFIVLLQPKFFGDVPWEKAWGPATAESITGFAGTFGIAAWLALLIDTIARRRWRSREAFFVLGTLIVLGIILAWPVVSEVFHFVFQLAANARLRLLFCFLLAVMTAAAIDLARERPRPVLIGVLFSAAMLLFLLRSATFQLPWRHDAAVLAILPSVVVLFIAALLCVATRLRRSTWIAEGLTMLLAVAVIAELWNVSRGWNPNIRTAMMYPKTPLISALDELREKQPPNDPFRIVGAGPAFFVNVPAVYGFEDIRAHDPMAHGRYLGFLRTLADYETGQYFAKWENFETPLLDYLNVRYVVAPPAATLPGHWGYRMVYDARDGRIFENMTVLPRFYTVRNVILEFNNDRFLQRLKSHTEWPGTAILKNLPVENDQMRLDMLAPRPLDSPNATMSITSSRGNEATMRVTAPRYTLVVSSIPWWPGWKITRNGERVEPIRVNGSFLGFAVPKGTYDVRVWYSPITFWAGVWLSLAMAVGLAVYLVGRRHSSQRGVPPDHPDPSLRSG